MDNYMSGREAKNDLQERELPSHQEKYDVCLAQTESILLVGETVCVRADEIIAKSRTLRRQSQRIRHLIHAKQNSRWQEAKFSHLSAPSGIRLCERISPRYAALSDAERSDRPEPDTAEVTRSA